MEDNGGVQNYSEKREKGEIICSTLPKWKVMKALT